MVIPESRSELLSWLNATLDLNYTKIEQCGTGAAYCQVIDSIYHDLPMAKVNFQGNSEYDYMKNYKILQAGFTRHKITRNIPVDRLVKCRFQDNLEFLQWIKKYWMENKDETEYDPIAGRSSSMNRGVSTANTAIGRTSTSTTKKIEPRSTLPPTDPNRKKSSNLNNPRLRGTNSHSASVINKEVYELKSQVVSLSEELEEYQIVNGGLESERNFYFNKLREIEILAQSSMDILNAKDMSGTENIDVTSLLKQVQEILYSTEEGFKIPDDNDENDENIQPSTVLETPRKEDISMLNEETF
ncbi:BA75_04452T0 [Komagataella pastoris]|uniref:BA75_04452T0 n=1 Tax=Komagataella pastoris TaxID=4922 RepID=A0A1B2JIH2_PICPA|nr:BA75_04452T0 [Komagataella pastoris]